ATKRFEMDDITSLERSAPPILLPILVRKTRGTQHFDVNNIRSCSEVARNQRLTQSLPSWVQCTSTSSAISMNHSRPSSVDQPRCTDSVGTTTAIARNSSSKVVEMSYNLLQVVKFTILYCK